jgi:hypothetical protein
MKRKESQPNLFSTGCNAYGAPLEPADPPAQRHSPTSVEAANSIKPVLNELQTKVFAAFEYVAEEGLTDEEGISALSMPASTYRPRRVELVEAGLVRNSGRTRPTASGRKAVVWVLTGK